MAISVDKSLPEWRPGSPGYPVFTILRNDAINGVQIAFFCCDIRSQLLVAPAQLHSRSVCIQCSMCGAVVSVTVPCPFLPLSVYGVAVDNASPGEINRLGSDPVM